MRKILAINQQHLLHDSVRSCLTQADPEDLAMLSHFSNLPGNDRPHLGLMSRAGVNNISLDCDLVKLPQCRMPDYDQYFDMSWADVTDQRAQQIEQHIERNNLRLAVNWSGGIDSTNIVVALLKNWKASNLGRVIIVCNWGSVIEYPVFYQRHILPNFQIMDSDQFQNLFPELDDVVSVDGSAADTLLGSMSPGLDQLMGIRHSDWLTKSWRLEPDIFIKYMAQAAGGLGFAQWYYERVGHSAESVRVPVETYFDFMWWAGFNYDFANQILNPWVLFYRDKFDQAKYFNKCLGWYWHEHYQQWAMNNNGPGVKHGHNLSQFKTAPKNYIFEYTKDKWYRDYKIKMNSCAQTHTAPEDFFAISSDFQALYLSKDLEIIQQHLPDLVSSLA